MIPQTEQVPKLQEKTKRGVIELVLKRNKITIIKMRIIIIGMI